MSYHQTLVLVFSSIYDSNLGYVMWSPRLWGNSYINFAFCWWITNAGGGWSGSVLAKYIPFKFAINVEFILCETENIIIVGLKLVFFISWRSSFPMSWKSSFLMSWQSVQELFRIFSMFYHKFRAKRVQGENADFKAPSKLYYSFTEWPHLASFFCQNITYIIGSCLK